MTKIVYTSEPEGFSAQHVLPWGIWQNLFIHRNLIVSMTLRDFRAAYKASYLGLAWQILLPLIMVAIFYLVFGEIMGGRFSSSTAETPLDYALALFVGLSVFNFVAQNLGSAPALILSNAAFVKTLSFPLEILPVTQVLNALLNLLIGLTLVSVMLLLERGFLHASAVCVPFYVLCLLLMTAGLAWGLSALAVFIRDVSAVISPLMLILMFMCPIFYPASMVPKKIKWVIDVNPLAMIIEDVRASLLDGAWPSIISMTTVLVVSLLIAVAGYYFFMRSKAAFADVM